MASQRAQPLFRDGIMILPLQSGAAETGGAQPPVSASPGEAPSTLSPAPSPSPEELFYLLDRFAEAWLDGCRRVVMLKGAVDPAWSAGAAQFNALLTSRGLEPMALRRVSEHSKAARTMRALFAETATPSRRGGFLGALSGLPSEDGADPAFDTRPALTRIQSVEGEGEDEGALFAIVPRIDPARCSGCDACVRICPPEALTLIEAASEASPEAPPEAPPGTSPDISAYHVHPESCDACGLCESVCEDAAIRLETMARAPDDIPLKAWSCRACGVAVHAPEAAAESRAQDGLCRICARTGHHKNLFVVLP